jgi:methyl-accepting chemotaxis protein
MDADEKSDNLITQIMKKIKKGNDLELKRDIAQFDQEWKKVGHLDQTIAANKTNLFKSRRALNDFIKNTDEKAMNTFNKGMEDLFGAAQNNFEKNMKELREASFLVDMSGPALAQLETSLMSGTAEAQMKQMVALLKLSESEGVQVLMRVLGSIYNMFLENTTQIINAGTEISNVVGNVIKNAPSFEPIRKTFQNMNESLSNLIDTVATLIGNLIAKLAQYPAIFQGLADLIDILTANLKILEARIEALNASIDMIDKWIRIIAGKWYINYQLPITATPIIDNPLPIIGEQTTGQIEIPQTPNLPIKPEETFGG